MRMYRPEANRQAIREFVASYIEEHGYSPTMREIAKGVGVNVSSAHHHIHMLMKAGEITMKEGQPRTMRMVAIPRERL